jgi:hypothetical protein
LTSAIPSPSSLRPTPLVSYVSELSTAKTPVPESTVRVGAIRVAITGSAGDAKSFVVERLETGEPTPEGTVEALLVLIGEIEGFLELATQARVRDAKKKS